jgi:molybdenum cofactor cytidylyltransferase
MPQIGALVLAASTGIDLGGATALAPWGASTLIEHVVGVVRASPLAPIVVVVGPRSDDILEQSDLGDATIVIDPEWREGRAAPLRSGLDTMSRFLEIEAAIIIDADRPGLVPEVLVAVAAGPRSSPAPVTVPKYRYALGGPIGVDRSLWPRLMGLEGDVDVMDIVEAHPAWINEVRVDRLSPGRVETSDDLAVALGLR